jgi:hypothetical protein
MRKLIVSCTTTKERLNFLFYMLESLKKQSLKPDMLFLNISREAYLNDDGIKEIPSWLNESFIKINWVRNTGSYRKLLPAIEKVNDNDIFVTADDDVLYGPNWLKSLVELAGKYPDHIVCARARQIKKNIFGVCQNYANWRIATSKNHGLWLLPIGCGGILYRKYLLDLNFLTDPIFKKIAPINDDLWFRMASLRKKVSVIVSPEIDSESVFLLHKKGLQEFNLNYKDRNIFQKLLEKSIRPVRDWLGINNTKNDYVWSKIIKGQSEFLKR